MRPVLPLKLIDSLAWADWSRFDQSSVRARAPDSDLNGLALDPARSG